MGVYYYAANMTKRQMFWPDYLADNWPIKGGCVSPDHPFAIGLATMMMYDWRGDHVVIADDTNPQWEGTLGFEDISSRVRAEVNEHNKHGDAQSWFMDIPDCYNYHPLSLRARVARFFRISTTKE